MCIFSIDYFFSNIDIYYIYNLDCTKNINRNTSIKDKKIGNISIASNRSLYFVNNFFKMRFITIKKSRPKTKSIYHSNHRRSNHQGILDTFSYNI